VDSNDPDALAAPLKKYGFRPIPEYWYAKVPSAQAMLKFAQLLVDDRKYNAPKRIMDRLNAIWQVLKAGAKDQLMFHPIAQAADIKNFYQLKFKPSTDPKEVRPYPLVSDGVLYVAIDPKFSSASRRLIKETVPGIRFKKAEGEMYAFFTTKSEMVATIREMRAAGLQIDNMEDLKSQVKTIRQGGSRQK